MAIKVMKPGLSTTVQDLGRPGYYHIGIPLSGGMDRFALKAANLLVGNKEDAAVLEAVFMGPELQFTRRCDGRGDRRRAAAEASTGSRAQTWTSFKVKKGQTLSFDFLKKGARAYIAVSGGIDVPVVLGSRSTYTLGALGGLKGRKLDAGDKLPVWQGRRGRRKAAVFRRSCAVRPALPAELRMMPGLYWHRITEAAGKHFFEDTWKVAPEADRIGYRFRGGRPLDFVPREPPFGAGSDPSNIVDACYPYGSIQVPGGTEPIVLHRDAVSGGGYFMVGTVISADMDLIGQLQPHTPANFVEVTMAQALKARKDRSKLIEKIHTSL